MMILDHKTPLSLSRSLDCLIGSPSDFFMSSGRTASRRRNRPSPSGGSNRLTTLRKSRPSLKPVEVLPKCLSEPLFFQANDDGGDFEITDSGDGGLIFRQETFNDLFSYPSEISDSPSALSSRTNSFQGYERDSKVVITVTVEGSTGPIRALAKLGATVEDTIELVIQKYEQEGRTPTLRHCASSSFDLHLSYFTLQSNFLNNTPSISRRSFGSTHLPIRGWEQRHSDGGGETKRSRFG